MTILISVPHSAIHVIQICLYITLNVGMLYEFSNVPMKHWSTHTHLLHMQDIVAKSSISVQTIFNSQFLLFHNMNFIFTTFLIYSLFSWNKRINI